MMNKVQIAVKNLTIGYGDFVLLKDLNFNINRCFTNAASPLNYSPSSTLSPHDATPLYSAS